MNSLGEGKTVTNIKFTKFKHMHIVYFNS